jgi:hypothetical protein
LARYHRRTAATQRLRYTSDGTPILPDLDLRDPDRTWSLWLLWHGLEKRYPPDVIERQDAAVLADLIALENASALVEEMLESERKSIQRMERAK